MPDTEKGGTAAGHLESDSGPDVRTSQDATHQPARSSPDLADTPAHQLPQDSHLQDPGLTLGEYTASESSISQYQIEDSTLPSQLDMSERLRPLGEEHPEAADVVESRSASSCSTHTSVVSARHDHLMQYLNAQSSGVLSSGSDLKETLSSERQETTAIWQHKSVGKSDARSSSDNSSGVWYALTSLHESSSDTRPSSDLHGFQEMNGMITASTQSEFLPMQSWHSVDDLSSMHVTKIRGSGGPASLPTYSSLQEEQSNVEGTLSVLSGDARDTSSPTAHTAASLTQIPLEDTPMHTDITSERSRYNTASKLESLTQFPLEDSMSHSIPSSVESSVARMRSQHRLSSPGDYQSDFDHHFSGHSDSLAWDQSIKFQPEVTRLTLGESYLHMEKRPLGSSTPSARPSDRFPPDTGVKSPVDEDVTPKAEETSSDLTDTTNSRRPAEETAKGYILYPPELQSSESESQDPSSSSRTSRLTSDVHAGLQEEIRDSIERLSFLRTNEDTKEKEDNHSKLLQNPAQFSANDGLRDSCDSDEALLMKLRQEAMRDSHLAEPPASGTDSQLERKRLALAGFSLETISQDSAYSTRLSTRHSDSEHQLLSESGSERQRLNSASTYRSLSDVPDRAGSEWDIAESLELRAPSMDSINNLQLQLETSTPEPDSSQQEKLRMEKNHSLIPQPATLSPSFSRRQYPSSRTPTQLSTSTNFTTSWSMDTEDRNEVQGAGDWLENPVLSSSSEMDISAIGSGQGISQQPHQQDKTNTVTPNAEKVSTVASSGSLSMAKGHGQSSITDQTNRKDHRSSLPAPSSTGPAAVEDNSELELLVSPGDMDSTDSSIKLSAQGDEKTSSSLSDLALHSASNHRETDRFRLGHSNTSSPTTTTATTPSMVTSPKHVSVVRPISVASSTNTEDTLDRDVRSILRKYGESLSDDEDALLKMRGLPEGLTSESESGSSTLKFNSHDSRNWYVEKYMTTDASSTPLGSESSTPQPPASDRHAHTALGSLPLVREDAALDAEVAYLSEHSDNEEQPRARADVRSNASSNGSTINTELIAHQLLKPPTLPLTYVSNNESDTDTTSEFRTTHGAAGQELNTSQLSQHTISSIGTLDDLDKPSIAVQDRHRKSEALKPVVEVPERLEAKDISKVSEDLAQRVRQLLTSLSDDASSGGSRASSRRSSQCGSINYEQLQAELDCIQQGLAVLQSGELALDGGQEPSMTGRDRSLPPPGAGDSTMVSSTASMQFTDTDRMSESDTEVGTPRLYAWDYAADLGVDNQSEGFLARKQIKAPMEDNQSDLSGVTSLGPDSTTNRSQHSGRYSSELLHSSIPSPDSGSHSHDHTLRASHHEPTESSSGERTLKPQTPGFPKYTTYSTSSSEHLIARSRSSGSSGLSVVERLPSPVISPKHRAHRDSVEDSYSRYGAYYTQRFAAADRDRIYGIPAASVSSSSSGGLGPKHDLQSDPLPRKAFPSFRHDLTYAQQVEQLMARDSPSRQAYSYLSEAELSRQSLDSRHSTPNASLNGSLGTPVPRAPLTAFHNIRSFLASQVDQRSKADFDASIELHSPYRRHMEANLGGSYARGFHGDQVTTPRFHTPGRSQISPVRRHSSDLESRNQEASSVSRASKDSYDKTSQVGDGYQRRSELAANMPSRPHSEPSPAHMQHSGYSSIYPHRRRYGGSDFAASPSLDPVSSSSILASQMPSFQSYTSPHNSTPLTAAAPAGESKSKQSSPTSSDNPSTSPLSNASLRPYRPPGSNEVYYVESETDDGNASTTTMESTHIGSDDANGPSLPANCYGSRQEPPKDTVGIYGVKKQVELKHQTADHLTPIREQASLVEEPVHHDPGQGSRSTVSSRRATPVDRSRLHFPGPSGSPHLATVSSRSSTPARYLESSEPPSSLEATVDGYCTPRESSRILKERKQDLAASLPSGRLYDLASYEQPLDLSRFAASSKRAVQEPVDLSQPQASGGRKNISDAAAGEAQKIIDKYINPAAEVIEDAEHLVTMDMEKELKTLHLMSRQSSDLNTQAGRYDEGSENSTPSQHEFAPEKLSPLPRRTVAEMADMTDEYRGSGKMEFAPMNPDLEADNSFMSASLHKSPSAPGYLQSHATIITAATLHSTTLSPDPSRHSVHQDLANTSIGDPRRSRSPYESSAARVDPHSSYERSDNGHRQNSPLRMDIPLNNLHQAERDLDHMGKSSLRNRTPEPQDRANQSSYSRTSERSVGKAVSWDTQPPNENTSYEDMRAGIRRDMNLLWQRFQRSQQQDLDGSGGEQALSGLLRNPVQHLVNNSKASARSNKQDAVASGTSAAFEVSVNSSGSYAAFDISMDDSDASSTKTYTVDEDDQDQSDHNAPQSQSGYDSRGFGRSQDVRSMVADQQTRDSQRRRRDKPWQESSGKRLRPSGESQPSTSGLKSLLAEETLQSIPEDSTLDSISTDYTTTSESDFTPRIAKRNLPSDPKLLKLQQKVHRQKEKFLMDRRKELKLRARIHMLERLLNERALAALGHDVSSMDSTTSTQSSLDTNEGDTIIEKMGDMVDGDVTVISDVTSTCSHMSDGTCTPPNFHRCDCGHKHQVGEAGDSDRATKTDAYKVKKAPLKLSEKNYTEPKASKKPGRSFQVMTESMQKSNGRSPTRQRQSTPAPVDIEPDAGKRQSRGKSPHDPQRRSPTRENKESREAKLSRSPHRRRQHSPGYHQQSTAHRSSDRKENSSVAENRRQMKERRSVQIQSDSRSHSHSPKRRAHSLGSSGVKDDVTMVSEGVQTSFSQVSAGSQRTERKTKAQGNVRAEQKANKSPRTLAAQSGVSWFIPFKEVKQWRQPLRERQQFVNGHNRFDVATPYDRRVVEPSFPPHIYVANYVTDASYDECAEKRANLQDACEKLKPTFISRSRERQKCIALRAEERKIQELHQHERELLFGHCGVVMPRPLYDDPLTEQLFRPKRRYLSRYEQKELTLKKYKGLPEVLEKEKQKKRESEYQTNRLRAKLYKQRLLNQVLKKRRNAAWN